MFPDGKQPCEENPKASNVVPDIKIIEHERETYVKEMKKYLDNLKIVNQSRESVKTVSGNMCETCIKQDVCGLQDEFNKALHDIEEIKERTNIFISVTVNCKHWYGAYLQRGE